MVVDNELIFYAMAAIITIQLLLLIYLYNKDTEVTKKFRMHQKAIEELNSNITSLYTNIKKQSKVQITEDKIANFLDPLNSSYNILNNKIKNLEVTLVKNSRDTNIKLEEIKEDSLANELPIIINKEPINPDQRSKNVIEMHNDGFSNEVIAKELKVPLGEIDFIIKRDNILHNSVE